MNKIQAQREIQARRVARVRRYGSPIGNTTLGVITAGLDTVFGPTSAGTSSLMNDLAKYFPLDFVEVTNNSAQALALRLDGNLVAVIPAGTIKSISGTPFRQVAIRNTGVVDTVTGTVSLIVQKEAVNADRAAAERN